MTRKQIKFRDWLISFGFPEAMIFFGVSEGTIRNWAVGRYIPRTDQLVKVRERSKGAVSMDEIIDSHLAFNAKKAK